MSNFQKLYFEGPYEFDSNTNQLTVTLKYQSNATATTGIGFGISYDSTSMTLVDVSAPIAPSPLISLSTTANDNSDPESVLHLASYTVFGPASWPGSTDADLYTLTFEPVANGNDNYDVELQITGTAAGYEGVIENHSAPVPLLVNEQSIDENSDAGQVVATVEGGPANATYSLDDNTVYGGSSSEAAALVIPELQSATQHVYVADRVFSADGSQVTLTVAYNADANVTGLGFEVLFDSSALTLSDVSDVLQTNLFIAPAVGNVLADASDKDGNSDTDSSLNMSWASFVGSTWPGTAPANLLSMTFDLAEDFDDSTINFVKTSGMAGYDFAGEPVNIEKPESAPLTIDSATGAVTLNEVPDYEAISEYNFDVIATADGSTQTVSATVSVNNLDEVAPTITSATSATVDENVDSVVIYTANADDSGDTSDGVVFSLGENSDSTLGIDENTGEVSLEFSVDFEFQQEISFSVIATDAAGNASTEQSVTVDVTNLDEVAPTITSSSITQMIDENSSVGDVIYTATADDSMDVSNGDLTFYLMSDAGGKVSIDSSTGEVTLDSNLDYETDTDLTFDVLAEDSASNPGIPLTVTIDLQNLDDSAPIFMSGSDISLTEGDGGIEETHSNDESSYMSQGVWKPMAYEDYNDLGSGIRQYTIADDHGGVFSIDSMTGSVSLDVAPDFEDENLALNDDMGDKYFHFTITVEDFAGNTAEQSVKLYVKDVAELPPVFGSDSALSIDENYDGSDVIYTASAVAHPLVVADGASDSVVYSLDENDNTMDFSIDSTTGDVTFSGTADNETQPSYSFTVVATDDLGNVNQLPVTLTVNDLDEVAPTIDSGETAVAIDENDDAQVIYTATADDSADISNGVTFSLGVDSDSALSIDSVSGEVSINVSADHEAQEVYSFSVIATDAAGNVSSEQSVSLDINDLDDTAATITSADAADAIDENTGAAQVIYTATADDSADVSDGISFSLAAGSDAALSIDADSGAVTLSADPDADTQSVYNFTVVVTDAAGNVSDKAVSLNITDLDEVAPTITSADTADAVDENSGAQVIYTVTSDDSADVSGGVTYSLAAGSDAALSIKASSGAVILNADPDAETQSQYSFTVVATDEAGNASEQAVTLDINDLDDTAPEIISPNTASVLESASENVAVYQAIVDDSADVSDGAISYSLAGVDAASFTVDSFGLVTLLDDPDTSLQPTYSFDVIATDSANNASQQSVLLTVVDQDLAGPKFTSAVSVAVDENVGADQHVYTATAADESSFVFSLAEGSDSALSIGAVSGQVTLSTDPDADVQAQYNFTVVATDEADNESSQSVTLTINDLDEIAPTITSESTATTIDENTGAGQVVYTAASNDSHDVVQQGAVSQKFIDNGDDTFTVQFFVDNSVAANFDQGIEGIGFTIGYMSDGSELSLEGVEYTSNALFALHNQVNNEIMFQAVYAQDAEYAPSDKKFYEASGDAPILEVTFNASDVSQTNFITVSDIGLKHSASNTTSYFNGQAESSYAIVDSDNGVTYSLADGSDAALSIDASTGAVTLDTDPDTETQSQYSFTFVATDAAGNTSAQSVTLDINDLDDAAATITSGDTADAINENSGAGQVIYTATADDSADVSGGVIFSLADGSDAALSIDAATGSVTLNADPDADNQAQYSFKVVATDAAGNVSDQIVTLDINDIDDSAAMITSGDSVASIDENSGSGQVIYTATADDSSDVSDGVTFSLVDGSDAALSINAETGAVTLNADPDADAQAQYSFTVVATDAAGNESTGQPVTLDINNLDDTTATITSGATAAAIDENSGAGQVVYTATADDSADVSDGVTFSLAAVSDTALSIDATTGAVTLNENPDADTQDQYSFTVVATDGAANASNQSVTLDINNLDEAAPTITSGGSIASIDENSGAGQVVYTATADDSLDVSGGVTFSLAEGSDSALAINEETGEVTLVPNPYAEKQDSYSFTVVATDAAGHSGEQSLQFSINDLHEVSVTYYSNNVEVNNYDMNDGVMSKSNQDVSDNTVDFADVIAALRMSVGLPAVAADNSETREAAADVVSVGASEGKVTTADAMALLHHSVGLDYHDSMGNKIDFAPEWIFNKVSSDENSTNYEAYILGDVDGSWIPSSEDNPVIILPESAEMGEIVFTYDTATQQVEGASQNLNIDEATGQITLKVNADFEGDWSGNTNFTVVSGSGNNMQTQIFLVEFANQDDTAPVFDSSSEVSVLESEESGQVVYVAVADDSADVSGGVTYSLGENTDQSLSIDSESGAVTLSDALVANEAYSFTVIAKDAAGNTTNQSVTLNVDEIPDAEAPVIDSGSLADAIDENSDAGQVIYTAQASDENTVTFTLGEGSDSALAIDASTGEVTLNASPDAETQSQYSFVVEATDAAGNSSAQTVTLDINDLDEVAPTFTSGDSASNIDENSGAGTVIYTATADDSLDVSEGLSFELATNSDPALSINPETGEVTLASNADFEIQSTYSFTVLLSDYANATVTQSVTLEINNLDEIAATITSGDTADAIDENSVAGQVIYTVTADDSADISDGVTFSLATDSDAALSIDAATGAVTLNAIPDADTQAQYSFTVVATDAAGNVSDQSVTLDINDLDDTAATITSGDTADAIDENSDAGQVIYTATADDSSDVSDGITFSLAAGSDAALSIDGTTGAVTLNAVPDADVQAQYSFAVVVTDAAGNESAAQSVTLDINDLDDAAPINTSNDSADAIDENSGTGQVIYTATAYDNADVSDGVIFSLMPGSDAALSIDAATGAVTLNADPDAEVQTEYSFAVKATDFAGNQSEVQSVTLDVNNLDDTAALITSGGEAASVNENSGSEQVIYTATADDSADVSDGVVFSLASVSDSSLSIDSATGEVTLLTNPDAELVTEYSFTVVATDAAGNESAEQSVTLNINDLDEVAATITSDDTADAIDENSGSGQVVYTATADDSADVSDGVTFSLAAGSDAELSIDADSGAVTLNADPDAETQAQYSFTVVATDAAGNESAGQSVTFDITDLDDTAATITSDDTADAIDENSGSGQVVYTASADDSADVSDGVSFSLAAGSDAALSIDADSGAVTLKADPDAETQAQYSFTVVATDAAGNESAGQSVTFDITDLDDTAATITSDDTADAIDENSGSGQVVYTATADDSADVSDGVTFSLAAGSDAELSIDAETGAVTLNADPDAETQSQYSFTVVATDAAGNESAAQSVTLDINDLDDAAATITSGDTANAIDENSGSGQVIYTATADDSADVSDGVTFSLAAGSDAVLSIDAETGAVTLNADPDAETQSQYSFTVVATDEAGNKSAAQSVTLDINNLDDSAPTITSGDFATSVNENADAGQVVYTATADDTADVSNGVSFSLSDASDSALSIDSVTGAVTLTVSPDAETQNQYDFRVIATDDAGNSSSELVSLLVNDLDEVSATITSGDAADAIDENSGAGQVIYTATADDSADVSNGVTFGLSEDSDAALSIDATTGAVTLDANPDAETQDQYSFTVVAIDEALNVSEQSVTLDINDLDDTAATITSGDTTDAIDENSGSGQVVYTATADDSADVSDGVTFSLAAGSDVALSIDADSGAVTLNADPDADTQAKYSFTVVATDAAGNESAGQSVTLDITDLDDAAPTITSGAVAAAIDENSGENQVIYTATADDSGDDVADAPITYSLAAGSDAALSIDADSGEVTLNPDPDAETQAQYSFTVVATDTAGNESSAQSVTLDINDIDDAAPTITSTDSVIVVEGTGSGQVVYQASSDDSGDDVQSGITYSLLGNNSNLQGDVSLTSNASGELAANTQVVSVSDVAKAGNQVNVTVGYNADNAELSGLGLRVHFDSSELTVASLSDVLGQDLTFTDSDVSDDVDNLDGNDNTDSFIQVGWASVDGNWTGDVPTDLLTINFDIATGASGSAAIDFSTIETAVNYDFVANDAVVSFAMGDLSINSQTGAVTLNVDPDHDVASAYNFTVVATDGEGQSDQQQVELLVAEEVANTSSTQVLGAVNQKFVQNADGSITMQLFVTEETAANYQDGIENIDLVLSYNTGEIGELSASQVSSPSQPTMSFNNHIEEGELAVAQIYFPVSESLQASEPFLEVDFNLQSDVSSASFNVSGVIVGTEDVPSSSYDLTVETYVGTDGEDVYALVDGVADVNSGTGSDTFIVSENTGENILVDFESGVDTLELGLLLDSAGYTGLSFSADAADQLAHQVSGDTPDIADLISDADSSLDNAFGGYLDDTTNVLTVFADVASSAGEVDMQTLEVTLDEGSTIEDDDLAVTLSAFIA